MSEQQQHWFAARTRDKQEFVTRDSLEKLRININLEYYLPTQFVIRQLKYRRKRVEVRATKQDACDLSNKYGVQLYYIKDFSTRSMLIVPDKQMEDFKQIMDLNPDNISFDNEVLTVGSKVRVMKGNLCGVEGELALEANKTYVIIRIEGVLTASVKVAKSYLKVIS